MGGLKCLRPDETTIEPPRTYLMEHHPNLIGGLLSYTKQTVRVLCRGMQIRLRETNLA